jgi:threonine dehydratase
MALEMLEEAPDLEALVLGVGGGSQAVGAMTAVRGLGRQVDVYGVQAERAAAIHDSWHAGRPLARATADTFADGLATRNVYELTFDALREGLRDFVAIPEGELAEAVRILLATTHNLVEGAGAAGLAGLLRLRGRLGGRTVGIVLSGANIDRHTLRRILCGDL